MALRIASRMGHVDTEVLFKHYIREFEAQDAEAAESMAAAIRKARRIERARDQQTVDESRAWGYRAHRSANDFAGGLVRA